MSIPIIPALEDRVHLTKAFTFFLLPFKEGSAISDRQLFLDNMRALMTFLFVFVGGLT